jgi:hypothetical protein
MMYACYLRVFSVCNSIGYELHSNIAGFIRQQFDDAYLLGIVIIVVIFSKLMKIL